MKQSPLARLLFAPLIAPLIAMLLAPLASAHAEIPAWMRALQVPCAPAYAAVVGTNHFGIGISPKGATVAPLVLRAQTHYLENFAKRFRLKASDLFAEEALQYVSNGAATGYRITIGEGEGNLLKSVHYTFTRTGALLLIESRVRRGRLTALQNDWVCEGSARR